jgi:hypothetical protein
MPISAFRTDQWIISSQKGTFDENRHRCERRKDASLLMRKLFLLCFGKLKSSKGEIIMIFRLKRLIIDDFNGCLNMTPSKAIYLWAAFEVKWLRG